MKWFSVVLGLWAAVSLGCRASEEKRAEMSHTVSKKMKAEKAPLGAPIYVRIFKEEDELELWVQKKGKWSLWKTYEICTWSGDLGPKLKEGDGQSPEGFYFVPPKMMNPNSKYHLAFNIGYPNAFDRAHKRTGSFIMVHGSCVSIGCYAMTDKRIEEIYAMADAAHKKGQSFFRVHIFPFRMTEANMKRHEDSEWYSFWENLKEGHDWFDTKGRPPNVEVEGMRYTFN